uniref:Uncharacterized protein n=1 Tax=Nelumbo nucifera TaxID=4432 RepID=A0A822XXR2_NELNU|nr:TPA_asm: hypothetical protein HUJ06_025454 [Nelumbo nucifera]
MSAADVAVVTELRQLVYLKDKFWRRDAVVSYEAAIGELKKEVKAKEVGLPPPFPMPSKTIPALLLELHTQYALESYMCRKIFHGFDNETFYMDGNLSLLLNPDQFRRDCFSQFRDMKAMDPAEPTCQFSKFCSKKYLFIVHPNYGWNPPENQFLWRVIKPNEGGLAIALAGSRTQASTLSFSSNRRNIVLQSIQRAKGILVKIGIK